jgi:hypothetical protein
MNLSAKSQKQNSVTQILSKITNCLTNEIQSLKDKLESAINERLLTVPNKNVPSLENTVKKEIRVFEDEGGGGGGVNVQLVYNNLQTTAPSSIEPERAFSAVNQVCTKIRSSLNDNTINS